MKHRKTLVTVMPVIALVFAIGLGAGLTACDNGSQETQFLKIGAPVVEIEPLGEYGFEMTWEQGLDIQQYVIYRARGEWPAEQIASGSYATFSNKAQYGKLVYRDIVEKNSAGDGSLKSDTKYVYTVLAIPRQDHIRDSAVWTKEVTTGTIVPMDTKAPVAGVSVVVDGLARTVTASATVPAGIADIPFDRDGITIQYRITLYKDGETFPTSTSNSGWGGTSYSPFLNWDAGDAEGSWTAKVETRFADDRKGYFAENEAESSSAAVYRYPFDRRYGQVFEAVRHTEIAGDWYQTNPGITPAIIQPYTATSFVAKIDFSGIRGLPGVTYTIQRRDQDPVASNGSRPAAGDWVDITPLKYTDPVTAPANGVGAQYEANYTEIESPIQTGIYGSFPVDSQVFDFLPVTNGAGYQYRIYATSSGMVDYVGTDAFDVTYNNTVTFDELTMVARTRTVGPVNSIVYDILPSLSTSLTYPGMWDGEGLKDDFNVEIYWSLWIDDGISEGVVYGFTEEQKFTFSAENLLPFARALIPQVTTGTIPTYPSPVSFVTISVDADELDVLQAGRGGFFISGIKAADLSFFDNVSSKSPAPTIVENPHDGQGVLTVPFGELFP